MAVRNLTKESIDQYELEHLLGKDAYAATYLAFDSEGHRHVLASILNEHYALDDRYRAQYSKRIRALSRFHHPNIAIIIDSGNTTDDRPYVISEQIEGFPLSDRLNRLAQQQSPAHVIYALTLVRQIASGLSLSERLGFFHYELTPRHILLRNVTQKADDTAVLVNLDIPPDFTPLDASLDEPETTDYLSPEQLNNKTIDGRSHVYSLGIILFQLLSAKQPLQEKPSWQRPLRRIGNAGAALPKLRTNLAHETYTLVEKATRFRPGSRYKSVGDFLLALDRTLAAEDLRIHTTDLEEPRHPRPLYLAPLLLLFICITLASVMWWNGQGSSTAQLPAVMVSESPSLVPAGAIVTTSTPTAAHTETSPLNTRSPTITDADPSPTSRTTARVNLGPQVTNTVIPTVVSTSTSEPEPSTAPTTTPPSIASPAATKVLPTPLPEYRISVSSASLRRGPGTLFDVGGYLLEDETVVVIGKNTGADIWYVVETHDGRIGWISASVGEPSASTIIGTVTDAVTIPAPPPSYTPTPTQTPLPTATQYASSGGGGNGSSPPDKPKSTPTPPL